MASISNEPEREHKDEEESGANEYEDPGAQVAPIVRLEEVAVTTGEEDEDTILDLKSTPFSMKFFQTYAEFIDPNKGLTYGVGDVDRDFDAIGLELNADETIKGSEAASSSSITDDRAVEQDLEMTENREKTKKLKFWVSLES